MRGYLTVYCPLCDTTIADDVFDAPDDEGVLVVCSGCGEAGLVFPGTLTIHDGTDLDMPRRLTRGAAPRSRSEREWLAGAKEYQLRPSSYATAKVRYAGAIEAAIDGLSFGEWIPTVTEPDPVNPGMRRLID